MSTPEPQAAAAFVTRFAAAWGSRDPERLGAILHPEVELTQPLMPLVRGRVAAARALAGFLALMPDLDITIHEWMARGELVIIVFSFAGTIGRRRVEWRLVDRIELADGLVRTRACYFDPRPLQRAVLYQPVMWPRLVRRGWRKLWRR